jgi:predicted small secreted protein
MKRNYSFILMTLFLTIVVTGCNMVRGAGKDVSNAGGGIQSIADHND